MKASPSPLDFHAYKDTWDCVGLCIEAEYWRIKFRDLEIDDYINLILDAFESQDARTVELVYLAIAHLHDINEWKPLDLTETLVRGICLSGFSFKYFRKLTHVYERVILNEVSLDTKRKISRITGHNL